MTRLLLLLLTMAWTASAGDTFPYIYSAGGHTHMRGSGAGIEAMVAVSKRFSGEYVWLRRGGREHLIRDAGTLAEIRAAFAEMHAFEPKVAAAEAKLHPVERRFEEIEERMDDLGDTLSDEDDLPNRPELEAKLRQAEQEMKAIEASYRSAERETERLERELDRLEQIAEEKLDRIVLRAVDKGLSQRVD